MPQQVWMTKVGNRPMRIYSSSPWESGRIRKHCGTLLSISLFVPQEVDRSDLAAPDFIKKLARFELLVHTLQIIRTKIASLWRSFYLKTGFRREKCKNS
jgi:hypothetical protein